jgi:hypothetical protein
MKVIFVSRTRQFVENNANIETKFPQLKDLQDSWGEKYQVLSLDFQGKFDLTDGDQIYVLGGHGKPGSGVVFWGDETNQENWLSAETVAAYTAERFPALYRQRPVAANVATKPSKESIPGISIKIYSCHSGEGGYNSFANRFARAFRPVGATYEVTIFGYTGAITPKPQRISVAQYQNVTTGVEQVKRNYRRADESAQRPHNPTDYVPADWTGAKESVQVGAIHRWSKINSLMVNCRASEARSNVASLKAEKGNVWQR